MNKKWSIAIVVIVAFLLLASYGVYHYFYPKAALPTSISEVVNTTRLPNFDHVIVIIEENKPSSSIVGSSQSPYINSLIKQGTLASRYSAVTHPSLPNYIALTSGTTADIHSDCNPPGTDDCSANVRNLADNLEAANKTWKTYDESMPAACSSNNSGKYAVKHNPYMYYPDIRDNVSRCGSHVVPYSQLADDMSHSALPNYALITPNLCNDMHDCSIQTGDKWLSTEVPKLLSSQAFTNDNSLLVITWDEGTYFNNTVPAVFLGRTVKRGYISNQPYSHYSLLHTIEAAWDLPTLTNNDKSAPVINDIFN